jgi:hypothetical protein
MRIRPSGVDLRPALACHLDSVLAWARPGGGRVGGDETPGSGAREVVCVFFYILAGAESDAALRSPANRWPMTEPDATTVRDASPG